jgi:hypothetical protein
MAAEPRSNRKGGDFFGGLYLQEGETNMNSLKDNVAVAIDAMYVIVGANGNTGSIIANSLLLKGEKVRVKPLNRYQ